MDALVQIKAFAENAHAGQLRRYSRERFMNHPERVMLICKTYTNDRCILAAALLHDVLEDTAVDFHTLKDFLHQVLPKDEAEKTMILVVDLTDVFTHDLFPGQNRKIRKVKEAERLSNSHPDAQTVKYADVLDNVADITRNDPDFAKTYIKECHYLISQMKKGHPQLHAKAIQVISECAGKVNVRI